MSEKFTVTVKTEKRDKTIEIEKGTTFEQLSVNFRKEHKGIITIARSSNLLYELASEIPESMDIEFLDTTNYEGSVVYARGASFLLVKSIKDIFGMDTKIVIENSLNGNLYCEIHKDGVNVDDELLKNIVDKMHEYSKENITIEKPEISTEKAVKLSMQQGMEDKARLLKYMKISRVSAYKIGEFYDYYYGYMVPSTGYINNFDLKKYESGFLLLLPSRKNPEKFNEIKGFEKISAVFMEQLRWCELMGVKNVADLNDAIAHGHFAELVRINEALHEKKIARIADEIAARKDKVKLILIAGPSSSGKTSFAQRLCIQLRVNGLKPHTIGMDNYFLDRDKTPLDAEGHPDYENINALDLDKFNQDLSDLIDGKEALIPSFDFILGKRRVGGTPVKLDKGDVIVCEGIHGLNDELTKMIPNEKKYRIFISAMTQLNVDCHNRISTSDSRLIRRIARDFRSRGRDAAATIETWRDVRRGEERNIFPFQENANVIFNSATIYELSVLKVYVEPLLMQIDATMPQYIIAHRLIKFLDYFLCASPEAIPNNSLIKEFVGGSIFDVN
ncbi:MAG: nucleoside kinase [Clostridia bacterium]|jgi:uridine kinase|nr:nucleoside kinase [Clostridia bacterium]MCI1999487.1 nucleoside kinase [Clostridia bacterium]MCI2014134.1 nucleoside kinase [Clostridia bacterium]